MVKRLREARLQAGMTQQQAARALAKPQQFISKAETLVRRLDPIELLDFSRVYRKPLSYFLKGL